MLPTKRNYNSRVKKSFRVSLVKDNDDRWLWKRSTGTDRQWLPYVKQNRYSTYIQITPVSVALFLGRCTYRTSNVSRITGKSRRKQIKLYEKDWFSEQEIGSQMKSFTFHKYWASVWQRDITVCGGRGSLLHSLNHKTKAKRSITNVTLV